MVGIMSRSKTGIFGRIKNAITGSIDDALDAISDPGQDLALLLDDLEAQIKGSVKDLKTAMVDRKVMERKLSEQRVKETSWQEKAEQALTIGDEALARAALERKSKITAECNDAEQALAQQSTLVDEMREQIESAKQKLKSLNLRRGSLMAQARAQKEGESHAAGVGIAASSKIDVIEDRIAQMEAFNEVAAETRSDQIEEARIERKLEELTGGEQLDDELEALKSKMKSRGAITDGSDPS